jgi:uncharacterized membrane protein YfcA
VTEWLLIPLGFAVGAFGTLIGAGGGFLLVPALLVLYPTAKPATITAISLAVVCFNAASGSIAYAREGRIDYRTGLVFASATVPGAVLGAIAVGYLDRGLFDGLFGLVLVLMALFLILRHPQPKMTAATVPKRGMVTRVLIDAGGTRYEYRFYEWQGVLLSVGVGFLSSLLGIGGGIIHVPAMVFLLDFPAHIATATSQLILAIMALAGSSVHLVTGELAPGSGLIRSLLLAVGVIPGAQLGAWLSHRLHGTWIIRLLSLALLLVGVRLLGTFVLEVRAAV